ncbi:hypothetical protein AVEN_7831-1 [Araneus ventricosus]|uniref:Uncharacterized protein n=1 Tax=Araneus ventricosus TaxID=182803 RepID=A0A4Y2F1V9_ARAVE|nr:hypothetical protein AVEN_7831-1 [Araneus ventricosus]
MPIRDISHRSRDPDFSRDFHVTSLPVRKTINTQQYGFTGNVLNRHWTLNVLIDFEVRTSFESLWSLVRITSFLNQSGKCRPLLKCRRCHRKGLQKGIDFDEIRGHKSFLLCLRGRLPRGKPMVETCFLAVRNDMIKPWFSSLVLLNLVYSSELGLDMLCKGFL